ncbi:hypothetical protein [Stappia sp.]|uniref:outer membrane protein n=1 Tax=Stappia sp. TaxID=1870903 RepID=UPI0032D96F16
MGTLSARLKTAAMPRILLAGFGFAVAGLPATSALAADPSTTVAVVPHEADTVPSPWSVEVAPYFWGAGMSGNVASFGARPVDVDMGFSDILSDLQFSGMVATEIRNGPFSLTTDFFFLKLGTDEVTPRGVLASNVDLDSSTLSATALAGYTVLDRGNMRLDALIGGRVWSVENTLGYTGGLLAGRSFTDSETWVDAMGGLKGRMDVTDRIYLTGTAIAGGGASNFGWDIMGGVGYAFSEHISAVAGYRALGVDYKNVAFDFDVTVQGPIAGVSLKF